MDWNILWVFLLFRVSMFTARAQGPARTIYVGRYELTFFNTKDTFDKSKAYCENRESWLVKADDTEVLAAIAKYIGRDGYWAGATDRISEGNWMWLDRTNINIKDSRWIDKQPDNWGAGEDCMSIQNKRGTVRWNDLSCDSTLPKICQKYRPDTVEDGLRVFTLVTVEEDGTDAKTDLNSAQIQCLKRDSKLAEIRRKSANDALKNFIRRFSDGTRFWLGGSDKTKEGTWIWNSGYQFKYRDWQKSESRNKDEDCIVMDHKGWYDSKCDHTAYYICEQIKVHRLKPNSSIFNVKYPKEINCSAQGLPSPSVSWYRNGKEIQFDSKNSLYQIWKIGESILKLSNATLHDEGRYTCKASNTIAKVTTNITKNITLKVPATPVLHSVKAQSCNSSIVVNWKPNQRALNYPHRINLMNLSRNSISNKKVESSETKSFQSLQLSTPWHSSNYILSIIPCEKNDCKYNYEVVRNVTSGGIPNPVTQVSATDLGNLCIVTWKAPAITPSYIIIGYNITLIASIAVQSPSRKYDPEITSKDSPKEKLYYILTKLPNRNYSFIVRAQTCAGTGQPMFAVGKCYSNVEAPSNLSRPEKVGTSNSNYPITVTINAPDGRNGPISCMFVIITTQNEAENTEYSIEKLLRVNQTTSDMNQNVYIAISLNASRFSSRTNMLQLDIGNELVTKCDPNNSLFDHSEENAFVGRNFALKDQTYYRIYTVTTTPFNRIYLFRKSNELQFYYETKKSHIREDVVVQL